MIENQHQRPNNIILGFIQEHIEEQQGESQKVEILSLKNQKVRTVEYLYLLPNLKIVDLRNNLLTSTSGFEQCNNLEQLHLCENNINKITNIWQLKNLKILDIRGNRVVDLNQSMANIPPSVVQLKARWNLISSLQQIFKLVNKLEVVWLDENRFLRNSKQLYTNIFGRKGVDVKDFWI